MNRFEKEAPTWDEAPQRKVLTSAITNALFDAIHLTKNQLALDYGAGTGLITLEIAQKVKHIVAMDSSVGMLGVLKEKIQHYQIPNISTELLDLEKSTLDRHFDVIFSSMTMHHIDEPLKLINVFMDALNPNGILAIADLDTESGHFHADNNGVKHFGFDRAIWEKRFLEMGLSNVHTQTAYTFQKETPNGTKETFSIFLIWGFHMVKYTHTFGEAHS